MKLITLNIHSIVEYNYEEKLEKFAEMIAYLKPDIFVLQESNQSRDAEIVSEKELIGCVGINMPIKKDNNAFAVSKLLRKKGLNYNFIISIFKMFLKIFPLIFEIFFIIIPPTKMNTIKTFLYTIIIYCYTHRYSCFPIIIIFYIRHIKIFKIFYWF